MTPAQQKAYYAKNKADAKVKEDKALYEITGSRGDAARKGMEEGRMDAMGTAYKKGGKVMKKMKKYEDGGEVEFESAQGPNKNIGDDVRARAMAAMAKKDAEETAVPKKTAAKLTPKATPKAETKPTPVAKTGEEKSGFEAKKAKALEGTSVKTEAKPTPKAESRPIPVARTNSEKTGFQEKMAKALGMKAGGKVKSASSRADGCAIRGKTRA